MRQTARIISTYTADVSGVCSALYELGGMSIIHDPSGCNSTYNTHDEPRWYDMNSMVYISGLTEIDAIMGNDQKLIDDTVHAAKTLTPKFIALASTPIPTIIGTDMDYIANEIQRQTGIPSFAVKTNSMFSYIYGVSEALGHIAEIFCKDDFSTEKGSGLVNILGATPLDYTSKDCIPDICAWLETNGLKANTVWTMNDNLENLALSGKAEVNLVISYAGLKTAKILKEKYGTPYVVGSPIGVGSAMELAKALEQTIEDKADRYPLKMSNETEAKTIIIGESVMSKSLAYSLHREYGEICKVISPVETDMDVLDKIDSTSVDEDEIIPELKNAIKMIADPMYKPICPKECEFISLPHYAFSGRIYKSEMPSLINNKLTERIKLK